MRRDYKPMLVEGREGDDVTVGRPQHLLMARNQPLHRVSPLAKKTALDEALHACVGDVRAVPRLHGKAKTKERGLFGDGREAKATDLGCWRRTSRGNRSEQWRWKGGEGKIVVWCAKT